MWTLTMIDRAEGKEHAEEDAGDDSGEMKDETVILLCMGGNHDRVRCIRCIEQQGLTAFN